MKKYVLVASIFLGVLFSVSTNAQSKKNTKKTTSSQSLKSEFQSLGDNEAFLEKAKTLNAESKTRIVQNRTVDLNSRFEIGGNYGINGGGDSYVNTQNLGAYVDFHFNPRWAIGVRYQKSYNELTSEGKAQYDRARAAQQNDPGSNQDFVGVDFPIDTGLFTVSYAPIYGKLNLFDVSVAHFDIYGLVGYGVMKLNSGNTDTYTAGIGSGIWLNQYFATRLEVRYQAYEDFIGTLNRKQNIIQGMFSIGILL
jgi:outer membrane beta-barrel protein